MIDKTIESIKRKGQEMMLKPSPHPDEHNLYSKGIQTMTLQAIDIVKQVAEEHKDGWIPCSERLPECKDRHGLSSGKLLISYSGQICFGWLTNGIWVTADNESFAKQDLIKAWQPLPKPYKEGYHEQS